MYHTPSGHAAGIAVRNAGQKMTYYKTAEPLPTELTAGYTVDIDDGFNDDSLVAAAGYARLVDTARDSLRLCLNCSGIQKIVL